MLIVDRASSTEALSVNVEHFPLQRVLCVCLLLQNDAVRCASLQAFDSTDVTTGARMRQTQLLILCILFCTRIFTFFLNITSLETFLVNGYSVRACC